MSLERVPWGDVPKYGVAGTTESPVDGESFPVEDLVEKPSQDEAPSNLAITGRYVFTPEIFDHLEQTELGVGDELQLTDAIRKLNAIRSVKLSGNRYDIGNIPNRLHANIEMALHHDEGEMNDAVEAVIQEYKQ